MVEQDLVASAPVEEGVAGGEAAQISEVEARALVEAMRDQISETQVVTRLSDATQGADAPEMVVQS